MKIQNSNNLTMTFTSRAYSYIHKESYCSKIQQKKCKKHALELGPHFDPFKAKKTPKACGGRRGGCSVRRRGPTAAKTAFVREAAEEGGTCQTQVGEKRLLMRSFLV